MSVAEQTWRAFIHGTVRHPGRFEVHAIPLDIVSGNVGSDVSPFLNRYLLRSAAAEVIAGAKDIMVYAKLCRILLVGHVVVENQARWRASRLSVVQGTFGRDSDHYLPYSLQQYMNQCAMRCAEAFASQSAKQKAKLRTRLEAELPRFAGSEMFRAMRADVARSGSDAFAVTGDLSDSAAGTVDNDIVEPNDA